MKEARRPGFRGSQRIRALAKPSELGLYFHHFFRYVSVQITLSIGNLDAGQMSSKAHIPFLHGITKSI